jgi:hypothetical protein
MMSTSDNDIIEVTENIPKHKCLVIFDDPRFHWMLLGGLVEGVIIMAVLLFEKM